MVSTHFSSFIAQLSSQFSLLLATKMISVKFKWEPVWFSLWNHEYIIDERNGVKWKKCELNYLLLLLKAMKILLSLMDGQLVAHDTQLCKRKLNYSLWSPWLKSWLKASLGDPCCSCDRIARWAKVIQEMPHRVVASKGIKQFKEKEMTRSNP